MKLFKTFPQAAALVVLQWVFLAGSVHAQYLAYSFKANPKPGKQIYQSACAACHGNDGKGAPQTLTVFKRPSTFPDFTRCDQTTAETNTGLQSGDRVWRAESRILADHAVVSRGAEFGGNRRPRRLPARVLH